MASLSKECFVGARNQGAPGQMSTRRAPANHEERASIVNEARRNSFGIYSSLEENSLDLLQVTTEDTIRQDILPELRTTRSELALGRFAIKPIMGVTYLKHRQMLHRACMRELKDSEFKLRLHKQNIQKDLRYGLDCDGSWGNKGTDFLTDNIEVGLNLEHIEWMDDNERSLAIFIDHSSEGYGDLLEIQARLIGSLERYSPSLASRVKEPDHIKILKYGNGNEFNQLKNREKNFCIEKIVEKMSQQGITKLLLKPLIFGTDYDKPRPAWGQNSNPQQGQLISA